MTTAIMIILLSRDRCLPVGKTPPGAYLIKGGSI
jgi:hypothetical protein